MNILNMAFKSINAEKTATPKGKIGVESNISVDNLEETKMGLDKTRTALKLSFTYTTKYTPEFAKITLKGESIVLVESEKAKKITEQWDKEKNKGLDPEFRTFVYNGIMNKCSLEAILLARELGLPSPVPLPRIGNQKEAPKKK